MKSKKLLAIILLSLSFCFVISGVGYGELTNREYVLGTNTKTLDLELLKGIVSYIMAYPESFLRVSYYYDPLGTMAKYFPAGVETKDKIVVHVFDSRDVFSGKTGAMLLLELEKQGFYVCYYLQLIVSDMDNDIVVRFMDTFGESLGYFYQGEYHLWDEEMSKEAMRIIESAKETERTPTSLGSTGPIYTGATKGHWVSEKIDGGRIIKLEDGSLWEVSPLDRIETMLWLITQNISIIRRTDPLYPYYLLNTSTDDMVEVKLISS